MSLFAKNEKSFGSLRTNKSGKSYGCELQPNLFDSIDSLKKRAHLDHLQVTIPTTVSYEEVLKQIGDLQIIAHSNLLNVFGKVSWDELKHVVPQIRSLNPLHVVEHFTAFRPVETEKTGLFFDPSISNESGFSEVRDKILRWQDLLGIPLCLENIGIAENVQQYFDFLLKIRDATECEVACDVPHFILSTVTAKYPSTEIEELAKALNPVQIHIGGLSVVNGIIRDNHKGFSPWLSGLSDRLFPNAQFITLEQNHKIPADIVESQLIEAHSERPIQIPLNVQNAEGIPSEILNEELTLETAKNVGLPKGIRRIEVENPGLETALELYEKYQPFIFPVTSLKLEIKELGPVEAVEAVASIARWAINYQSWWAPDAPRYARISYGEGDNLKFTTVISEKSNSDQTNEREKVRRFNSKNNEFWCEIATPVFKH